MADATLTLTILTQEKQLLETVVRSVTVMTTEGEITVLPNHIPLFVGLADGELVFRLPDNTSGSYAVSGGFLDVGPNNTVTILADYALRSEDINAAKAEQARQLAQETMQNKQSEVEFKLAEASLRRALTELKIAERRKVRQGI